jgi:hypothetical protein
MLTCAIRGRLRGDSRKLCNQGEAIYFLMNQEKAKEMGFLHCDVEKESDEQ